MLVFPRRRRPSISGNISIKVPTLLNALTWAQYFISISVRNANTERMFVFVGDLWAAGRHRVDAGPWKVRALGLFFFFLKDAPFACLGSRNAWSACVCVCERERAREATLGSIKYEIELRSPIKWRRRVCVVAGSSTPALPAFAVTSPDASSLLC